MPKPRKYLVKKLVYGGPHIKTFNSLASAKMFAKKRTKLGIPHIYKLVK